MIKTIPLYDFDYKIEYKENNKIYIRFFNGGFMFFYGEIERGLLYIYSTTTHKLTDNIEKYIKNNIGIIISINIHAKLVTKDYIIKITNKDILLKIL